MSAGGLGAWLLSCWPLALRSTVDRLRSTVDQQERDKLSLARDVERLEEAREQLVDDLDQMERSRRRALRRADAAEVERDQLRAPKGRALSVVLVHRPHPADDVLDRIDQTVEAVS